jgi:hypothetical protein
VILVTARHDRSIGIESVEQQYNWEPGEGLLDARRQPVKGIGLAILLALLAITWLIFKKLAHQGDGHSITETEAGLQDVDIVLIILFLLAIGIDFSANFAL